MFLMLLFFCAHNFPVDLAFSKQKIFENPDEMHTDPNFWPTSMTASFWEGREPSQRFCGCFLSADLGFYSQTLLK